MNVRKRVEGVHPRISSNKHNNTRHSMMSPSIPLVYFCASFQWAWPFWSHRCLFSFPSFFFSLLHCSLRLSFRFHSSTPPLLSSFSSFFLLPSYASPLLSSFSLLSPLSPLLDLFLLLSLSLPLSFIAISIPFPIHLIERTHYLHCLFLFFFVLFSRIGCPLSFLFCSIYINF